MCREGRERGRMPQLCNGIFLFQKKKEIGQTNKKQSRNGRMAEVGAVGREGVGEWAKIRPNERNENASAHKF